MVDRNVNPVPLRQPTAKIVERTSPGLAKEDDPSTPSAAWTAMEDKRKLPRVLMAGTEAMRDEGEAYTPRLEAEEEKTSYKDRLANTFLIEEYKDAVEDLTGKVFAADLELVDVSPEVEDIWSNIDRLGQDGDVFTSRVCEQSAGLGLEAILIDHPPGREDGRRRTAAEDQIESIRPYWVHIRGHQILEAVPMSVGASTRLSEIRILEETTVKYGKYGSKVETRVRHYFRGDPSVSEVDPESKRWAYVHTYLKTIAKEGSEKNKVIWKSEPLRRMKPQVEIPIAEVPTGVHGFFYSMPPLEGLAQLNLQHWQKSSHYDRVLMACSRPIPVVPTTQEKIDVSAFGPDQALYTGDSEVKPYWLELTGQSVPLLVSNLERIENQMRRAGKAPMTRQASGDEKATIRILDEAKASTSLQRWANEWMDALSNCIRFTEIWMGIAPRGSVALQKGIYETLQSVKPAAELTRGALGGKLSAHGWQTQMQKRGELTEDHDIDADMQRLESEKANGLGGIGGLEGLGGDIP